MIDRIIALKYPYTKALLNPPSFRSWLFDKRLTSDKRLIQLNNHLFGIYYAYTWGAEQDALRDVIISKAWLSFQRWGQDKSSYIIGIQIKLCIVWAVMWGFTCEVL